MNAYAEQKRQIQFATQSKRQANVVVCNAPSQRDSTESMDAKLAPVPVAAQEHTAQDVESSVAQNSMEGASSPVSDSNQNAASIIASVV